MGSSEKWRIHTQGSHFLTAIGYCWFLWCFITKVWSVHHIILVMWSVLYGVFRKVANPYAGVTLFNGDWLLLIFMMFHYKSMVSSSYNNCHVECAIGGLQKSGKSICRGHTLTVVGYCWSLWCFITKVWSVHHIIIVMWCVLKGVFRKVANPYAGVTLFDGNWLLLILMMFHYSQVSSSYNHCHVECAIDRMHSNASTLLHILRNAHHFFILCTRPKSCFGGLNE